MDLPDVTEIAEAVILEHLTCEEALKDWRETREDKQEMPRDAGRPVTERGE